MRGKTANILIGTGNGIQFVKCPSWTQHKLFFLDAYDKSIKSTDLSGEIRTEARLPFLPCALEVLDHRTFLVAGAWNRKLVRIYDTGQMEEFDLSGPAISRLSGGMVRSQHKTYIADVGYDFADPRVDPVPNGTIVCVNDEGQVSVVAENLFFPSGMVETPDEKTLIVAEAKGHRLTAFDITRGGTLGKGRVWAKLAEEVSPDGLCIDSEGAVWVATAAPRALRVVEGGQVIDEISAMQRVFSVALGGPGGNHLFLCTSISADPIITRRSPSAMIEIAVI